MKIQLFYQKTELENEHNYNSYKVRIIILKTRKSNKKLMNCQVMNPEDFIDGRIGLFRRDKWIVCFTSCYPPK